jgi:septal ring factor EnvC (AmiA/AmiB activator)
MNIVWKNILNKALQYILYTLILLIAFLHMDAFSQNSKEKLQKDKLKLEAEIIYTTKLLSETKKEGVLSVNQVIILKTKIAQRQELISIINSEIDSLNLLIKQKSDSITVLNASLKTLKDNYAKMICFAYKNRSSYDRMMFLFSASDFNQAYLRLLYLQQYSEFRKKQAEKITQTQQLINIKLSNLELKKAEMNLLMNTQLKEKKSLLNEVAEKDDQIKKLKTKETELVKTIKDKEKTAAKLQSMIEKIIAEEIKKATNKSGKVKTNSGMSLTPTEIKLSADFAENKGKLPWPTENGIITSTFGEHPHPLFADVKIKNDGIDISTNAGSNARAIFNGIVTGIISTPGSDNKAIIIRHGEYVSVYVNIASVYVKVGETVKTKQNIGLIDTNESKTELELQIWYGTTRQNPEDWIVN